MNLVLASARIEGYRAGRDDMSRAEITSLSSMVQSQAMGRDLGQGGNRSTGASRPKQAR